MKGEKRACPSVGAPGQARWESHWTSGNSHTEHTTNGAGGQAGTVSRLLSCGKENAITGNVLVKLLGLHDLRELTQRIESERRAGLPICASTDMTRPGYYLPACPAELEEYISSLDRRLHNVSQTRRHLEVALLSMSGQESFWG